jgi:hypothetical protein
VDDPIDDLKTFLNTTLSTARPGDTISRVPVGLTADEARWFLDVVTAHAGEPALLTISGEGKLRSDRYPLLKGGEDRGYVLPSSNPTHDQETVVHWSAIGRLHHQFNWPREYIICESPRVEKDGETVIKQDAVDILLLDQPRKTCAWKVQASDLRPLVVAEVKRNSALVDDLIEKMRTCWPDSYRPHDEHNKCLAIDALRPRYFLAIGAAETWRLFDIKKADGHLILGNELSPDLSALYFRPT